MERETRFELATPTLARLRLTLLLQCFLRLFRSCNCLELLGAAWGCSIFPTTLTQLRPWCDASDRASRRGLRAYPRTNRRLLASPLITAPLSHHISANWWRRSDVIIVSCEPGSSARCKIFTPTCGICSPTAKVLIKGGGRSEHYTHSRNAAGIPVTDVLIEGGGAEERGNHIRHTACIPVADVLVESGGVCEHASQVRHVAHIPAADVVVECFFRIDYLVS